MEHAKPMQALRHSALRDRVIAGVARKKTTQREQERNISKKRGRRSGATHSALGKIRALVRTRIMTFVSKARNLQTCDSRPSSKNRQRGLPKPIRLTSKRNKCIEEGSFRAASQL